MDKDELKRNYEALRKAIEEKGIDYRGTVFETNPEAWEAFKESVGYEVDYDEG